MQTQTEPVPYDKTTGTTCADCGAVFPVPEGACGAEGYAVTAVPRFPHAKVRTLARDGTNYGTKPCMMPNDERAGAFYWPAHYDVEGEQAAHDAKVPQSFRRICYTCSALLESETLTARGRGCLYLSEKEDPHGPFHRRTMSGVRWYRYELSNWPGNASRRLLGRVRESTGYGFGGSYPVRTFRFVAPNGFVWSGRCAGHMELARVRRTKELAK